MELTQVPLKGYAILQEGGDIQELTQALSGGIVRRMPDPMEVPRVSGAFKAYSFHWSNASRKWDVITIKDFPASLDGAEFILFTTKKAISPADFAGWSLAEMRYVAKALAHHPGFANSFESMQGRIASRWLEAADAEITWDDFEKSWAKVHAALKSLFPSIKPAWSNLVPARAGAPLPSGFVYWGLPSSMLGRLMVGSPLRVSWDLERQKFAAESFGKTQNFRLFPALVAFLKSPAKVKAFVAAGLGALKPEEQDILLGRASEVVVEKIDSVTARYSAGDSIDTVIAVKLQVTDVTKPVEFYTKWLEEHWREVQAKAPSKVSEVESNDDWYPNEGIGESWSRRPKKLDPRIFTPANEVDWRNIDRSSIWINRLVHHVMVELRASYRRGKSSF